jgi:hypothetical protein
MVVVTDDYGAKTHHILQFDATDFDLGKSADKDAFHYPTTGLTPIAKLFLLGTIKFATCDAYGIGTEDDGERPSWNDVINGLLGIIGGGTPEMFELKELIDYILSAVDKNKHTIVVPEELGELFGCN